MPSLSGSKNKVMVVGLVAPPPLTREDDTAVGDGVGGGAGARVDERSNGRVDLGTVAEVEHLLQVLAAPFEEVRTPH
jgi:hypothetical protein